MRRFFAFLALSILALALAACENETPSSPAGFDSDTADLSTAGSGSLKNVVDSEYGLVEYAYRYEITLENLTPDTGDGGSQVFSPPVIATHHPGIGMFRLGGFASPGMAAIAEDAMNGPMVNRFASSDLVREVFEGDGVIFPGSSASWMIEGMPREGRLSMAFMLVNTNDGFSGVNSLRLPTADQVTFYLHAYDAGSELNTELASDIPGPCCGSPGMGTETRERIRAHRGIRGDADLDSEKWGWNGPVARLTIARVR